MIQGWAPRQELWSSAGQCSQLTCPYSLHSLPLTSVGASLPLVESISKLESEKTDAVPTGEHQGTWSRRRGAERDLRDNGRRPAHVPTDGGDAHRLCHHRARRDVCLIVAPIISSKSRISHPPFCDSFLLRFGLSIL